MSTNVFRITFHCTDKVTRFKDEIDVVAQDDVIARQKGVKKYLAGYNGYAKSDVPIIEFCEIKLIASPEA
jgi:hypothetical protein